MSFETSKMILKVFGVISVIFGALGTLVGSLLFRVFYQFAEPKTVQRLCQLGYFRLLH